MIELDWPEREGIEMKASLLFTLLLSLLFVFFAPFCFASKDSFVPQWRVGDRWLVKSQAKSQAKNAKLKEEKLRTRPSLWIYKVVNAKDVYMKRRDYRLFHILARNWKTPPKEELALLFLGRLSASKKKVISLNLIRAAYRETGKDAVERRFNEKSQKPYPVINDISPIPFTFPLFVQGRILGKSGAVSGVDGKDSLVSMGAMFSVTEKLGKLPFAKDVLQRVDPLPKKLREAKCLIAEEYPEDACLVTIKRPSDNREINQIWHRDYPWFLYSETARSRSMLARLKRGREK